MHFELLPGWTVAGAIVVACGLAASFLWSRLKARRRREQWHERRRKNIAYARAWDWIMGRRAPRLTDQRSGLE